MVAVPAATRRLLCLVLPTDAVPGALLLHVPPAVISVSVVVAPCAYSQCSGDN